MGARSLSVLLLPLLLAAAATPAPRDGEPRSCEAVRKVFQLRQLGSLRGVPEFPRAGEGSAGGPQEGAAAAANCESRFGRRSGGGVSAEWRGRIGTAAAGRCARIVHVV